MNAKKVPDSMESPLDNHIYNSTDNIVIELDKIGWMSPNVVTTIGLIFGVISILFFVKGDWKKSILFLLLYYYFDCMDGYYARKFGKVTRFGDYYDHFRDWFVAGVMITLLFIKLKSKQDKIVFASITATLLLFCSMYVGCQEVIGEEHGLLIENSSPTLGCTRGMCPNPTKTIKVVRFFGPSTFVIFLCVYIWYSSRSLR